TLASVAPAPTGAQPTEHGPLVLLKRGTGTPLFIVHGLGGVLSELSPLAQHLASQHPVYGYQALHADIETLPGSIEELARFYVRCMQQVQPRGPYLICGYSFGGVIALEMARNLLGLGEQVPLLLFLDSYTHPKSWPPMARLHVLGKRVRNRLL